MSLHLSYDPYYYYPQPQDHHTVTYSSNANVGVNTLFVSGLPDDVKAREIHNLFRRHAGFDFCQLKFTGRGNQIVAFATFFNHQSALAAMDSLNGVKFDPQTGSTLHIELAQSDSRRKHKPGSGPYIVIDRRTHSAANALETSSDDGNIQSSGVIYVFISWKYYNSVADEEALNEENNFAQIDDSVASTSEVNAETGGTLAPSDDKCLFFLCLPPSWPCAFSSLEGCMNNQKGLVRCSTLFVANLGPNCTETELKQLFSGYQELNIVKLRARGGMPVAFADFQEIEQAVKAMEELQDSLLPTSDRGGMHIEYARSKMRKS
ncbi:uncharacterized protein [Rutidosis leptorrhynchoides]|uniref:uncharacterized protein n=1 Tax=Rutidosis leptorrhynchoides TaxID=125765 RepID=UPI003A99D60B